MSWTAGAGRVRWQGTVNHGGLVRGVGMTRIEVLVALVLVA